MEVKKIVEEHLYSEFPSVSRRQLLNFLTGAVVAITASPTLYTSAKFLIPPAEDKGDGSIVAKDRHGFVIPASQILAEPLGTRALVAGLAGEPTYLAIADDNRLDSMGIVDNCTHLGCTFPWNSRANEFQCPCHGSRYGADGSVIRGPAPLPLKLVRVTVEDNKILLSPWKEDDPRTGEKPWWI